MNIRLLTRLTAILIIPTFLFTSCGDEPTVTPIGEDKLYVKDYPADVAWAWNELFLQVERHYAFYRPGPGPRALAHMGLAAYEACITGMPDYNSLESRFAGLDLPEADPDFDYHWPSVVHGVYREMMPRFFPEPDPGSEAQWEALLSEYNARLQSEAGQAIFNTSVAYGEAVGEAMWNWSATDVHAHDAYKDPFGNYDWQAEYDGPGDWVATSPGPGRGMFPFMTRWRTFVVTQEEKVSLPPSAYYMDYSSNPQSEYYSQALQVYTKNAQQDYLTEWVGEFWSDDLVGLTFGPGPRWLAIASQAVKKEKASLQMAVEAYAKVGMALNDAVVSCWHSKYLYNVERPETFIRAHIDPNYQTNLSNPLTGEVGLTPSFPAYPSGHATMGASAAEALASVFGYAYSMTDRCHQGRTQFEGTPRTFGSFYEMAQENAWSRVLLGVHFRMDADEGMRFGTGIGRKVNMLPWKK